jgi:hypothetical protein
MEVFVLTATQDLVYFGLWQGSFPRIEWLWTPFYWIFGSWTTTHQILLSFSANLLSLLIIIGVPFARQRQRISAKLHNTRVHEKIAE